MYIHVHLDWRSITCRNHVSYCISLLIEELWWMSFTLAICIYLSLLAWWLSSLVYGMHSSVYFNHVLTQVCKIILVITQIMYWCIGWVSHVFESVMSLGHAMEIVLEVLQYPYVSQYTLSCLAMYHHMRPYIMLFHYLVIGKLVLESKERVMGHIMHVLMCGLFKRI